MTTLEPPTRPSADGCGPAASAPARRSSARSSGRRRTASSSRRARTRADQPPAVVPADLPPAERIDRFCAHRAVGLEDIAPFARTNRLREPFSAALRNNRRRFLDTEILHATLTRLLDR